MKQYLEFLETILQTGQQRSDRTGTGTIGIFGYQMRFDLSAGFPLVTTKKCHLRSIIHELLWFMSGDTNIRYLKDNKVSIWDEWADKNGDLGPVYGYQWRHWGKTYGCGYGDRALTVGIDQLSQLIDGIKKDPTSRRHIVSAWNVSDIGKMALPPCHALFQFYVHSDGRLSCQLYQRSADAFLGVPFNIASYALLTLMVAQVTGLKPGHLIHTFGDAHIYANHINEVKLQLTREPRPKPIMTLNQHVKGLFDFKFEDFLLEGYDPHPVIKGEISV